MAGTIVELKNILPIYELINGVPQLIKELPMFIEGGKTELILTRYERDERAREKCLKNFGCTCRICGFDFEMAYGEIGKGFIHVHHIIPLSKVKEEYVVDPLTDLITVCPNCHAMLHKNSNDEPISIEELRLMLQKQWGNL